MLTLYFAPGASSMAPHIALHEIGVPFVSHPISFARREQRTPAFLAINPEGNVPILLIDGRPLTEVAGILFYLAKRFPEADLLPAVEASPLVAMEGVGLTTRIGAGPVRTGNQRTGGRSLSVGRLRRPE